MTKCTTCGGTGEIHLSREKIVRVDVRKKKCKKRTDDIQSKETIETCPVCSGTGIIDDSLKRNFWPPFGTGKN